MPSYIDPHKLTPHSSNALFDPLPENVYQTLKNDIAELGFRDALQVTADFTIIAGHYCRRLAMRFKACPGTIWYPT